MVEDGALERLAFYMLPENRVVQLVNPAVDYITLRDPMDGTTWTVPRAPFEERVADGRINEVEPQWRPAGEPVTAEA